jgi:hypothetical protein
MAAEVDHDLSDEQAAYYRNMLAAHTGSRAGECSVCGVPLCPDWTDAFDKLATANQLMAEPCRWESGSQTSRQVARQPGGPR